MICPNCKLSKLEIIEANEPYSDKYLMCPTCNSTYNIEKG